MDTKASSLVARCCNDTPFTGAPNRDRLAAQSGIIPLLHGCVEGIEIHMDDTALPLGAV
jgi:hypothetical protein